MRVYPAAQQAQQTAKWARGDPVGLPRCPAGAAKSGGLEGVPIGFTHWQSSSCRCLGGVLGRLLFGPRGRTLQLLPA